MGCGRGRFASSGLATDCNKLKISELRVARLARLGWIKTLSRQTHVHSQSKRLPETLSLSLWLSSSWQPARHVRIASNPRKFGEKQVGPMMLMKMMITSSPFSCAPLCCLERAVCRKGASGRENWPTSKSENCLRLGRKLARISRQVKHGHTLSSHEDSRFPPVTMSACQKDCAKETGQGPPCLWAYCYAIISRYVDVVLIFGCS